LPGSNVAVIGPVEYKDSLRSRIADRDNVMDRINGNSACAENLRLRPGDHPNWCHIAVGGPGKDEDCLPSRNNDFVVNAVQREFVVLLEKSFWTLNRADRSHVTACATGVEENRFS